MGRISRNIKETKQEQSTPAVVAKVVAPKEIIKSFINNAESIDELTGPIQDANAKKLEINRKNLYNEYVKLYKKYFNNDEYLSIDDLNKQGKEIESKQWGRKITDLNKAIDKYGTFQEETRRLNNLISQAERKRASRENIKNIPGEKVRYAVTKIQSKITT